MSPTDSLGVSWQTLTDRLDNSDTLTRWSAAEPALAGITTPDELAGIVHRVGNAARADHLLGALVRLAARDGDEDAAALVAHLLANGTRTLALAMGDLSSDIDDLIAGELWLRIRTFPWQRRTRAFAKSLLLDTRAAVLGELRPHRTRAGHDRVLLVDPIRLPAAAGGLADVELLDGAFVDGHDRDESGLLDVLAWAQRSGVVDSGDVALLIDLVRAADRTAAVAGKRRGLNVAAEIAHVAAEHGVNPKTIRRRRDRALSALRAANPDYLDAVA